MASRLDLQAKLEAILGTRNVYFQPPESMKISYPAIIYSRNEIRNRSANNGIYIQRDMYQIIVVDPNPDSIYVRAVSQLPTARHSKHYTKDNLNHDVFSIFY